MKKIIFAILLLAYLGTSQLVSGVSDDSATIINDSTDLNPNGSSELSLLMRQMFDHAAAARKLTLQNQKDGEYPKMFDAIYTAEPTDAETKNNYYDTFAGLYLNAIKNYSSSNNGDLKSNYNNLVNTCLACHSTHCPGPVPKIKKLLIP